MMEEIGIRIFSILELSMDLTHCLEKETEGEKVAEKERDILWVFPFPSSTLYYLS